jgi:hypothetical protein
MQLPDFGVTLSYKSAGGSSSYLFIPERNHRINAGRAAGRNETGQGRHDQQNERYRSDRRDIVRPTAVRLKVEQNQLVRVFA